MERKIHCNRKVIHEHKNELTNIQTDIHINKNQFLQKNTLKHKTYTKRQIHTGKATIQHINSHSQINTKQTLTHKHKKTHTKTNTLKYKNKNTHKQTQTDKHTYTYI